MFGYGESQTGSSLWLVAESGINRNLERGFHGKLMWHLRIGTCNGHSLEEPTSNSPSYFAYPLKDHHFSRHRTQVIVLYLLFWLSRK
jgi:hypothetical protein